MFGFFKKSKDIDLVAPVDGEVINLESVPDEVFSKKLAGDGVAIIPSNGKILAPIDGVISRIFPTNHAFSIEAKNGVEVMVHIGLDTVELKGKGFKALKNSGDKVKAGEEIIDVDLEYLKSQGKNGVTPIILSGEEGIKDIKLGTTQAKSKILKIEC